MSEELLRTRINAVFDREIARIEKIRCDLPTPHDVSLWSVVEEYKALRIELLEDELTNQRTLPLHDWF